MRRARADGAKSYPKWTIHYHEIVEVLKEDSVEITMVVQYRAHLSRPAGVRIRRAGFAAIRFGAGKARHDQAGLRLLQPEQPGPEEIWLAGGGSGRRWSRGRMDAQRRQ